MGMTAAILAVLLEKKSVAFLYCCKKMVLAKVSAEIITLP